MSRKSENILAGHSFSGVLSATFQIQPGNGIPNTSIPEQCRPNRKSNRLFANYFRSMVGHLFVKSHTFTFKTTGKGYGRKNN